MLIFILINLASIIIKSISNKFLLLLSSCSIFGLTFAISQPANANINCESGTFITHANGSLYTCVLSQKATVQLSYNYGISTFPCQAQSYILFDVNGQFQRCQLAEDI